MSDYYAPTQDMRFVLEEIVDPVEACNLLDNKPHILRRGVIIGHIEYLTVKFNLFVERRAFGNNLVLRQTLILVTERNSKQ